LASRTQILVTEALIQGFGTRFDLTPQQLKQCNHGKCSAVSALGLVALMLFAFEMAIMSACQNLQTKSRSTSHKPFVTQLTQYI